MLSLFCDFNSLLDGHGSTFFQRSDVRDSTFYRASVSSLPVALQYTPNGASRRYKSNGDRQIATVVGFPA